MAPKKDKRSGDPGEGGLTTGEKSAITRAVHEGREIRFTEDHPEKKEAAERYAEEVKTREAEGGASPKSPKSPKSPRGKKK